MPVYNDTRSTTVGQAKANSVIINAELLKANPAGIIDFFEIDLEDILFDNLLLAEKVFNTTKSDIDRVFRFHNCLNFTTKTIIFQGKEYTAAPIFMSEVEYATKGALPRPKLSIASNSKGAKALTLFKNTLLDLGDITNGKLVRRRTFTKFIDASNSPFLTNQIPNFEPNPNALLRLDLFYFFRKTQENETSLEFELASKMDVDNVPIPKRIILQDKCVWQYRGEGCCYEKQLTKSVHGIDRAFTLPATKNDANPVADINNLPFIKKGNSVVFILPNGSSLNNKGEWTRNLYNPPSSSPKIGDFIFIQKNGVKYYFVCIEDNPTNISPPNVKFWKADQCSKSIQGCSLRFNASIGLPFGGFAAVKKTAG